jgi:hypothetical protein
VAKSVGILSFLLLVAPLASAQISKCVAKDGTDLYQNFPCGIDSIGSMATSAPGERAGPAQSDPKQAKPNATLPAGVNARKPAIAPTEPRVGMTVEEVKAIWGEPEEVVQDEPMDGRVDIWRYADSRSVRFSNRHRVLAVQR